MAEHVRGGGGRRRRRHPDQGGPGRPRPATRSPPSRRRPRRTSPRDIGAVVHAAVTDLLATAAQDDRPARLVGCGVVVPGLVDEATRCRRVLGEPRLAGPADPRPGRVGCSACRPSSATTCAPACWPRPGWVRPAVRGTRCSCRSAPASPAHCCSTARVISGRRPGRRAGAPRHRPGRAALRVRRDRVPRGDRLGGGGRTGVRRSDRRARVGRGGRRTGVGRRPGRGRRVGPGRRRPWRRRSSRP